MIYRYNSTRLVVKKNNTIKNKMKIWDLDTYVQLVNADYYHTSYNEKENIAYIVSFSRGKD